MLTFQHSELKTKQTKTVKYIYLYLQICTLLLKITEVKGLPEVCSQSLIEHVGLVRNV